MNLRRFRAALPLLLLTLSACPQRTAVWIGPASPPRTPVMVFGEKDGRERRMSLFVRVDHCRHEPIGDAREALWSFSMDTSRVTYGVIGPGISDTTQARPLAPGCYRVTTSGTGQTIFIVEPDGAILELKHVR